MLACTVCVLHPISRNLPTAPLTGGCSFLLLGEHPVPITYCMQTNAKRVHWGGMMELLQYSSQQASQQRGLHSLPGWSPEPRSNMSVSRNDHARMHACRTARAHLRGHQQGSQTIPHKLHKGVSNRCCCGSVPARLWLPHLASWAQLESRSGSINKQHTHAETFGFASGNEACVERCVLAVTSARTASAALATAKSTLAVSRLGGRTPVAALRSRLCSLRSSEPRHNASGEE